MATTYLADNYREPVPSYPSQQAIVRHFKYTMTAAFVVNDIVKLAPIQALSGLVLDDFFIDVPALDTSTGVVSAVGDNTTAAKFITGSTIGRSSAGAQLHKSSTGLVLAGLPAVYTADNDFAFKVTTAPTTGTTTGTFKGWIMYHYTGQAITL